MQLSYFSCATATENQLLSGLCNYLANLRYAHFFRLWYQHGNQVAGKTWTGICKRLVWYFDKVKTIPAYLF
jgi:hypothetical protein